MYEVQSQQRANELLDYYQLLYRNRYGIDPVIQSLAVAYTTLKDLERKVGTAMVRAMLATYLESNGDNDWYKRNGHSLAVFQKNIEVIASQVGLRTKRASAGKTLRINLATMCANPRCGNRVYIECNSDEVDRMVYSESCPQCEKGPTFLPGP
jgi:hypothetical protein